MFLITQTRPDIAFAASVLSRFLSNPQEAHQKALQHLFRYLRGTTNLGIKYVPKILPQNLYYKDTPIQIMVVQWLQKDDDRHLAIYFI